MDIKKYLENLQVVVISGGPGIRLLHRTGTDMPKALLKIKGHTLMEYCLKPFADAGYKNFVFLLGVMGEKIQQHVEGIKFMPKAKFCIEKENLGKGGAIKNALDIGLIDREKPCITVFPDDLFLNRNLPSQIIAAHFEGLKLGCKAMVIRIEKTRYAYGWVKSNEEGIVTHFEEKPWLPYPANSGIFVFEPEIYNLFDELIDLKKGPVDFEDVVIPKMVQKKLLFSMTVPFEQWIPVNDEKEFQRAEAVLAKNPLL